MLTPLVASRRKNIFGLKTTFSSQCIFVTLDRTFRNLFLVNISVIEVVGTLEPSTKLDGGAQWWWLIGVGGFQVEFPDKKNVTFPAKSIFPGIRN